jgi:hypothetical protein
MLVYLFYGDFKHLRPFDIPTYFSVIWHRHVLVIWNMLWPFGICCDLLVHVVTIWYTYVVTIWYNFLNCVHFLLFGMLNPEKSGNPGLHRQNNYVVQDRAVAGHTYIHTYIHTQAMYRFLHMYVPIISNSDVTWHFDVKLEVGRAWIFWAWVRLG